MAEKENKTEKVMKENKIEKVINLCSRRGIIFPNSEIYGTLAGFFDYGPYGTELKRNVEESWWNHFVRKRRDVVGLDGAIISHPQAWKASGHVDSFTDPLVECRKCKQRFRADHLLEEEKGLVVDGISLEKTEELIKEHKIVCPKCKGELSAPKVFNLMFKTFVGATEDETAAAYLRPETAQLIFLDFKKILLTSRKKLPFGIAQIGKAFRNEISPRNFIFRCREFSQMELEFFVDPNKLDECSAFNAVEGENARFYTAKMQEGKKDAGEMTFGKALGDKVIGTKWHGYWLAESLKWFTSIGVRKERLRLRQHVSTELSHYSSETWDIEYDYPEWGWKELEGIANRGNFDLKQHQTHSGKDLTVYDEETKEKVLPHVIEPSSGVDRTVLTLLIDAFEEKEENGEVKTVLHLRPSVAPVKCAVFPLVKKDGLAEKAREIYGALKEKLVCEYDESGSVGKRYARQDEIGTPYCVTVDYQTMEDSTVTVRDRDTTKQERVKVAELVGVLEKMIMAY